MEPRNFVIGSNRVEGILLPQGSVNVRADAGVGGDESLELTASGLTMLGVSELYESRLASLQLEETFTFDKSSVVQTTIKHVDAATTLLNRHWELFEGARQRLDEEKDTDSLHERLRAFIDKWGEDPDVGELLQGRYYTVSDNGTNQIVKRPTGTALEPSARRQAFLKLGDSDNDSSALFKLSRALMDDYHNVNGQHVALQRLQRRKLVALKSTAKTIAELERRIDEARVTFENREKDRSDADADYALARGLLDEQLQAVDAAFVERDRVLSDPVALCYVRVHDHPVTVDFRQSPLRVGVKAGALPSGCDIDVELPSRLQSFLDLLNEQAMADWQALTDDWRRLPKDWLQQPPRRVLPALEKQVRAMPSVFHRLIPAMPVMVQSAAIDKRLSQADKSKQLARRITLEQLAKQARGELGRQARALQDDLHSGLACLLQQLQAMPAASRFAWSRLAEDDRLDTRLPHSWPGFGEVARQTAALVLGDIISWLYAQLSNDASGDARNALRTAIRACLLQSVNDDPADLLQGDVVEFPGIWQVGAIFTANLNQIPALSAQVRVYDDQRRLIGQAKVVDSNEQQARIEVEQTFLAIPSVFAAWTVVGNNR